ncbi:aminotransferase class III-fold pyridoxal phosphate-dependent enzyme [Rhodococcus opacus]|nr:aminotransferase class III-fold pyridoxal phosphate-dependent enzyme [Rhodococcus opacus]
MTRGDDLVVIDFDDFGAGWYLFDLATIVFFYLPHPRYGEYRRAMFEGYRTVRPLTDDDLQMWDAMLVARGLTYLGWAGRRRGDDTAEFIVADLAPLVVDLVAVYLETREDRNRGADTAITPADPLLARRSATLGPHAMLFYTSPLHVVSGTGVWLRDVDGEDYLDAYNNVPHVGHCHPRVVDAVHTQLGRLNIHTRYLNERIVDYAESLLATFEPGLNRVFFTNSGSESNELAIRIARQHTGHTGLIVSDFSYHGNTIALAELTTGLTVKEPLGSHVRAVRVPDLAGPLTEAQRAGELATALAEVEDAIASLTAAGHGVCAALFDPLFSTEGLPWVPREYIQGVTRLVRAAGGLVIADEVQSGFGRVGSSMWGYQMYDVTPDLVTLGKPMGNGHPVGAVVTTTPLSDEFGANNLYFNTFAGNPVSAAAATAVLETIEDEQLLANARAVGDYVRGLLQPLVDRHDFLVGVRGRGLFFGLEVGTSVPRPDLAKEIVERMRTKKVLISKVGRDENVLKMRPPLVFSTAHADLLVERLTECLGEIRS